MVVKQLRVADKRSQPHCARVLIQGVPAYGIIDSRGDITIVGGALFKRMAMAARQKKREFIAADKTPYMSDQCSFALDGRIILILGTRQCGPQST